MAPNKKVCTRAPKRRIPGGHGSSSQDPPTSSASERRSKQRLDQDAFAAPPLHHFVSQLVEDTFHSYPSSAYKATRHILYGAFIEKPEIPLSATFSPAGLKDIWDISAQRVGSWDLIR